MKDREIDRILSEEEILPSSGFAASVMDAVYSEAAAPPPIPFPWRRALPGLVVGGLTLALAVVVFLAYPEPLAGPPSPPTAWTATLEKSMASPEWRFAGMALLVTFFSLVVPIRASLRRE